VVLRLPSILAAAAALLPMPVAAQQVQPREVERAGDARQVIPAGACRVGFDETVTFPPVGVVHSRNAHVRCDSPVAIEVFLDSTLYKNTPATKNRWARLDNVPGYAESLRNGGRVIVNTAWGCGAEWGYSCIEGSYKHVVEATMISPSVEFPTTLGCTGGQGINECSSFHRYSFT
jgi:hypothetical protein